MSRRVSEREWVVEIAARSVAVARTERQVEIDNHWISRRHARVVSGTGGPSIAFRGLTTTGLGYERSLFSNRIQFVYNPAPRSRKTTKIRAPAAEVSLVKSNNRVESYRIESLHDSLAYLIVY